VPTQHRSRRARALRLGRLHAADAADELSWEVEEEAPEPMFEREPLVRQLVSAALRRRGWSVLERADGSVALTVAPETLDTSVADYSAPSVLSPSAARKARSIRSLRSAFVHEQLPIEELASAGSSARD
jgi:CheY-like chemotaxis protein